MKPESGVTTSNSLKEEMHVLNTILYWESVIDDVDCPIFSRKLQKVGDPRRRMHINVCQLAVDDRAPVNLAMMFWVKHQCA